jgi:excisionase family DNA binding protein
LSEKKTKEERLAEALRKLSPPLRDGAREYEPFLYGLLDMVLKKLQGLEGRIDGVEKAIGLTVEKESYTATEAAERLGKVRWTVSQWCNKGQARGKKVGQEWRISHAELLRLQSEGPSPPGTF